MRLDGTQALRLALLLCWLSVFVLGIDQDKLGIKLNKEMATRYGKVGWWSIIEFKDGKNAHDVVPEDGHLAHLVKVGWDDMLRSYGRNPFKDLQYKGNQIKIKGAPAVMAALVVGTKIYFASSMKAGVTDKNLGTGESLKDGVIYVDPDISHKVYMALVDCQVQYWKSTDDEEAAEHRNGANCAEVMAAIMAFEDGQKTLTGAKVSALMHP